MSSNYRAHFGREVEKNRDCPHFLFCNRFEKLTAPINDGGRFVAPSGASHRDGGGVRNVYERSPRLPGPGRRRHRARLPGQLGREGKVQLVALAGHSFKFSFFLKWKNHATYYSRYLSSW